MCKNNDEASLLQLTDANCITLTVTVLRLQQIILATVLQRFNEKLSRKYHDDFSNEILNNLLSGLNVQV